MRADLIRKLDALVSCQRGNFAVTAAVLAVPLMLAAGFAVDYSAATSARASLQNALDAAVLAGAAVQTTQTEIRISTAQKTFQSNETDNMAQSVSAQFSYSDNVVNGTARGNTPMAFMKLAGINLLSIEATAAAVPVGQPLCLLALDPYANSAIDISGGSSGIQTTHCGIQANSSSSAAITNTSNTRSTVDFVCAVGGASGNFNVEPKKCQAAGDPYANLPVPPVSGCDAQSAKTASGQATYSPGVYCGGISITGGQVNFQPGVYVVKDGELDIAGNAIVTGNGVVFYFYGEDAVLQFAGNAETQLSAPTSGPYEGLIFVQNPDAASGASSQITGTNSTRLVGAGYFPTQTLAIGGSGFGTASNYMTFVAEKYRLFGNGQIQLHFDPKSAGFASAKTAMHYYGARLIE